MRRGAVLVALVLGWTTVATAFTYVVAPDGSGDYPTIQAALTAAQHGDTIELTDGIFRGDGNRDLSFAGKAITLQSQSADPTLCIIDCEGTAEEPHRGFHFFTEETDATIIRGITVSGGSTSDC